MGESVEISNTAFWVNSILGIIAVFVAMVYLVRSVWGLIQKIRGIESEKISVHAIIVFISIAVGEFFFSIPFKELHEVNLMIRFVLILNIIIFIHELGHFLVAKLFKVNTSDFSVGFGNSLLSYKIDDTTFHLRLLPAGGYIKLNNDVLNTRSSIAKIFISLAGIFFNFLTAAIAYAAL